MSSGTTVHYAPGEELLCGSNCPEEALTENSYDVTGCADCLELIAEDLADDIEYMGRCLHCRREITVRGGLAWRRAVRRPYPHCGQKNW